MITSNSVEHKRLEKDIETYLDSLGFDSASATYHDAMPDHVVGRLIEIYTPDSLYIRGRADRIAIHRTKDIVFGWEAKTGGREDMSIELLPLAHHLNAWQLGARTIYFCRNTVAGYEKAFWCDTPPRIVRAHIPPRYKMGEKFYRQIIEDIWGSAMEVSFVSCPGGTDDVFVWVIPHLLDGWQDCMASAFVDPCVLSDFNKVPLDM